MKNLRPVFFACLLLLSSCKDAMHVQTGYVSDRDECRGRAENNVGVYSQPEAYGLSDKEKNTALLQLFCECMKGKEWKVAGCPKPPTAVAAAPAPAAPPTVVVVQQSPTAQPGYMQETQQPAPARAIQPVKAAGKKKRAKVCLPPTVCPAPENYSTYSPATSAPPTQTQSDQQLNSILQRQ